MSLYVSWFFVIWSCWLPSLGLLRFGLNEWMLLLKHCCHFPTHWMHIRVASFVINCLHNIMLASSLSVSTTLPAFRNAIKSSTNISCVLCWRNGLTWKMWREWCEKERLPLWHILSSFIVIFRISVFGSTTTTLMLLVKINWYISTKLRRFVTWFKENSCSGPNIKWW